MLTPREQYLKYRILSGCVVQAVCYRMRGDDVPCATNAKLLPISSETAQISFI
ncbi:Hypothetical protein FKW44_005751 [Caligus rogercresseyi]|uniref:Uncharacterized protein n=1 Tax=Caligus rogercresseyi TaxID=217165 RepID=A0A7T8KCC4_CALRO|nr:Hypothetical protein FKW44_005751 [Caligus rogercresseyi]